MYQNLKSVFYCFCLFLPFLSSGQGTGNSPYSQFGMGDIVGYNGNIRNIGMGYAGVSARNPHYVNFQNPALLPNLRTPKKARPNHKYMNYDHFFNQRVDSTVKIDFSVNYQHRGLQSGSVKERSGGMNLYQIMFALPLSKTWATSIGMVPFSTTQYNLTYNAPIIGDSTVVSENSINGRGGVYKFFWAHGFGITKNISAGAEFGYLFGNINHEYGTIVSSWSSKSFGFKRQTSHSSFSIKPGLNFRKEIVVPYKDTIYKDSSGIKVFDKVVKKTKSSGLFYNIGFTYDLYSDMNIRQKTNLFFMEANNLITMDTTVDTKYYNTAMPPAFRIGASIDKPLKWTLAADFHYAGWSAYQPGYNSDTLADSYGFSLGTEFVPGQLSPRSKMFRAGISYLKTPIIYRGKQLEDVSFSIGASIPFSKKTYTNPVLPRLNIALVAGQRGEVTGFGIREQYLKVFLSVLINEKWFNKRKIY